jgi:RHS repeat-associated protein
VFGFTGEYTDPGDNLVYLRARYYNPTIGQFFNLDPLETPNRYAYVNGNVVNRRDPSGLVAEHDLSLLTAYTSCTGGQPSGLPSQTTTHTCESNYPDSDFTCEDFENAISQIVRGVHNLRDRLIALVADPCGFWEIFQGTPLSSLPPAVIAYRSANPCNGDWAGHIQQITQRQKTLDELMYCYRNRGVNKALRYGDHTDVCDPLNTTLLSAATAWTASKLPIDKNTTTNGRGTNAPTIPATVPVPYVIPTGDPEPNSPYGRGNDIPSGFSDVDDSPNTLADLVEAGVIVTVVVVGAALVIIAPEFLPEEVGGALAICQSQPQLCTTN